MDMYFSAKTQTLAQFKAVYDKRRLNETPQDGSPVIFCAMANQTPQNISRKAGIVRCCL